MTALEVASRRSFRRQIILTFVVGFFLVIAAFSVYLVESERKRSHLESIDQATGLAQSLAASSLSWVLANDVEGLQEVVLSLRNYPEFRYAMVISPPGRVLAHSDAAKVGQFLADEKSLALLKAPPENRIMRDDESVIEVAVPVSVGNRLVGWARIGMGREGSFQELRRLMLENVFFVLVATILSLLAAMLIANRLGQRIGLLVKVAEEVQAGNFATRAIIPGAEDEITRLAYSLNQMLDALARNEGKLREASHYTRSLIEASLDPLVTINPDGKITDVNEATMRATGIAREALVGSDFSNYFTEPDKARSGYREVYARGFVTDYPLAIRHVSGAVTDVLYNASLYRDEKGEVAGVFAAARDVSALKRAEQDRLAHLRFLESMDRVNRALQGTNDLDRMMRDVLGVVLAIFDCDRAWLFYPCDQDATSFRVPMEITRPEYPGAGILNVDVPLPSDMAQNLREALESADPVTYAAGTEKPINKVSAEQFGVKAMMMTALYPRSGKPWAFGLHQCSYARTWTSDELRLFQEIGRRLADGLSSFLLFRDLREEREHLEELVATRTAELTKSNDGLEAANRELEAFAYSVSHDLRVPLRAIDGFSRILLEDYSGKIDDEGQRLLNVVRDNTVRMARLIDDILAFSRAGRSEITPAPIDMDGAVRAVLEELKPATAGRKLTFDIRPLAPANGDAAMIRRVWTNLIDNAIKFTAPRLDAVIEIGSTAGKKETTYYVKDNGAGFDMQYADKLFGAFQRLHGSEFPGTGIGLAIVKRIVARHGGRVWAEGKVNEGATFYFALPIREDSHA